MHFVFILLNLESQDLPKYFEYITPVIQKENFLKVFTFLMYNKEEKTNRHLN